MIQSHQISFSGLVYVLIIQPIVTCFYSSVILAVEARSKFAERSAS